MRLLQKIKFALLGLVLVVLALGFYSYRYLNQPMIFDDQSIDIAAGSGFSTITARLQQQGLISQSKTWKIYARLTGKATRVQAGEYLFESGLSPVAMLDKLVRGDVVKHQITLVEGWTFKQLLQALAAEEKLEHQLTELKVAEIMAKLGYEKEHPEGRFFPDSYQFTSGTSDEDILRRAYLRLSTILEEEWQQRDKDLPYKNAYQALIMASIVEKETGQASERPEIAGVFVRRLQKGMRLQTDPTVIYGLGDSYKGNIRRKHLKQPTPYNTYVIRGLPPTPIAMVGREAIHAALHPKDGKSLYFVAKGDGSHFFSDTLAQHNKAVRRYQLKRVEQYRSSPNTN
jgi:peptidoglycan lytic transglycosylase G